MSSRDEQMFNNVDRYVGFLEPDGTLLEANETLLNFGILDRDDVIGEKIWNTFWFQFSDDVREQIRDGVETAARGESVSRELEIQGAETTTIVDLSIRPLMNGRGEVTRLVAEGYNITPSKGYEPGDVDLHPGVTRPNLLVSYSRDVGETMSGAVLHAFLAIDIDVFEKDTTLQDWIDTDVLNGFDWDSGPPHTITTRIWDYDVRISADEILIYSD